MFFLALAADYDGTIAELGAVSPRTIAAMEDFKRTGRKLLLVTGRELDDLQLVCPRLKLFDRVVAENGALLFNPSTGEERVLAPPPPDTFVAALKARGVAPLSIGRSIVATWEPNEKNVLDAIRELGLELQIIFNKGAVMVLPPGVNKASGLTAALKELELSPHNVVGVGDAENDHAFLRACGCSAAVANALPMLKATADIVMDAPRGDGVAELAVRIAAEDAALVAPERHGIMLGAYDDGTAVFLHPHRGNVLIAGSSGIGKSTIATALTERMVEKSFQFCIFDPEGDYIELENAVCFGDAKTPPVGQEVLDLLRQLDGNAVVCTLAVAPGERPSYFAELFPKVTAFRHKRGRPHWLIVDEAHHVLPAERQGIEEIFPADALAEILITVHPESVSANVLKTVDAVVAVGAQAPAVIETFCKTVGIGVPAGVEPPGAEHVLFWRPRGSQPPRRITVERPRQSRKRHTRKYAEGELGPDRSFYFRGPENALNLRAQNLMLFLQIADGVDDGTWMHHLRQHDYSTWFSTMIKNDELATEAAAIENDKSLNPAQSRKAIADAVLRRYTMPEGGSQS